MEVHLPQQQEAQLNALAAQTDRRNDELVQEAVAQLLAYNQWFQSQVQIGIDQIARGEFIQEEEMDARVERMLHTLDCVDQLRQSGKRIEFALQRH